jgi:hypothetical protein
MTIGPCDPTIARSWPLRLRGFLRTFNGSLAPSSRSNETAF